MIKMDELKPILAPLLTDENSVEIIEAINKIDTHSEGDSELSDKVKTLEQQLADNDKSWNARFREAFLNGEGVPPQTNNGGKTTDVDTPPAEEEPDGPKLATSFDELFTTENKDVL